jgi:F420H(2)-dependent quinone reductase
MVTEAHAPFLPPRWFIRTAWVAHRALYRTTRGRMGLRPPGDSSYGLMRLRTIGRRSGAERVAILAYAEDGPNVFTLAMNGWGDPEPAWWLNLQAQPEAVVELPSGMRAVRARAAEGEERARLWERLARYDNDLDRYAAMRSRETAVVVLEPSARPVPASGPASGASPMEAAMSDEITTGAPEAPVNRRRMRQGSARNAGGGSGGAIYGLGMIGAAVYFFSTATTRDEKLLALPKALVWPAILVCLALRRLNA